MKRHGALGFVFERGHWLLGGEWKQKSLEDLLQGPEMMEA